jgi:uncharacterized delta-60 repeat protein
VTTSVHPNDSDKAYGLAIQDDGKIVVVGKVVGIGGGIAMARYTVSGTLDSDFGTGGIVTTSISSSMSKPDVSIQDDGKIVVAGGLNLMRYTASGALDTSFGTNGTIDTSIGIESVAIQNDGKIVVAGSSSRAGSQEDFTVARYTVSGTLDTSFGAGGMVVTIMNPDEFDWIEDLVIQNDGKIVVAGIVHESFGQHIGMVRYTVSGTLDTDFGSSGIVTTSIGSESEAHGVAIQEDGKIVVAGGSVNVAYTIGYFTLVRYTASGALDMDFGAGGIVTETPFSRPYNCASSVAIQKDGKIVAAGWAGNGTDVGFAVARYTASGTPDTSFGINGMTFTPVGPGEDWAYDVAIQEDGKIVAAGYAEEGSSEVFAVVRYYSTAPYSVFLPLVIKY